MPQNSHNLISRLTWDTVFDSKAQGVALQERLSNWSGFHLQQEMAAVFSKFCPPGQTWKIQSLELDLGIINFDQLETELPIKIRQQLNEKLVEMILYSHQRGKQIEILDEKRSHVQLIRYFLWNGALPWNHQAADGTVNQILALQLQQNREELLDMLKESGFSSEQVRRRMAWQFNEPNMIKIIEAIEPNVGGQIIMFSNELTKIQQKETVVQAVSTTDFKKNVWFWVLNYLLTERGTVFNRIQFMKSSIVQMAAHYNMQYNQLFELIELAVAKLTRSLSLQSDFILTLQLLSKENKDQQKHKTGQVIEDTDHWYLLELLFRDQNLRHTAGKLAIFNDLVSALAKEDALRFKTLISSFGSKSDFWLPLINDLSSHSLKVIFTAFKYYKSVILTESIIFLNRLMGSAKQQTERNQLWYEGLMFILRQENTSFTETAFLQVLIVVLAKNKQLSPMALLDQLLVAEVPATLKTLRHTSLYHLLTAVFKEEVSRMPVLQFKKHIEQLIALYHFQVKAGIKDRKSFETLENILENYTRLYPKVLKEALMAIPDTESLAPMFPASVVTKNFTTFLLPQGVSWSTLQEMSQLNQFGQNEIWLAEMQQEPKKLLEFVKKEIITDHQWLWLQKAVGFDELLVIIGNLHPNRQPIFNVLNQFYRISGNISFSGVTGREMQFILFKKVTKAWTSGNWKLITAENIWNELIWEFCGKRAIPKAVFISHMNAHKPALPPLLQLAFESLIAQDRSTAESNNENTKIKPVKLVKPIMMKEKADNLKGGISVRNAGMVIINSYIAMLFERLGLTHDRKFINAESQMQAAHYLQYIVTGQEHTEESFLPLNKILCGIPLAQPVMEGISISAENKQLIKGLINAVISHWTAIGSSSIDGFRGNWLVRDGLLTEREERWELMVDRRPYDLLIHRSPFSFSIIKHPWMDKHLHVNWTY
ncbi:contractile injection system tape measure protein [Pedobacter sp. PF22-3]|uniref:contractile injection system tape measure protein n=1 Tax=Pedobacter sp. PF22-3 TaxID=2994467 RepID=UPI0022453EE1|nr:contractile injection system tape measure protein [Pedobacter sp. PF22-3]MCX2494504.1 contractile injection system tape measure protein [Pedobacter sp. PF22-3]